MRWHVSVTALLSAWAGVACTCDADSSNPSPQTNASASASSLERAAVPRVLYLPDAAPPLLTVADLPRVVFKKTSCPPEMVKVAGQFCVDRYESALIDTEKSRPLSPYYHPSVTHTRSAYRTWQEERFRMGEPEYQNLPLPEPPAFQLQGAFDVKSVVRPGITPNGYLNYAVAKRACENAGKRLCSEDEWVRACRGEEDRDFPYGDSYEQGTCNVFAGAHPAGILHSNFSLGHLDPRLNHFRHEGAPLLDKTGANAECASHWGGDAIFDMVGNLDEWIEDEEGTFLGGFYARATREGCAAKISAHPVAYFDYSLGVRCCL
jgi:formylglycine-generating enzyme